MEKNSIKLWESREFESFTIDNLELEKIEYDGSLLISLSSNKLRLDILFQRIVSYRILDESYLLRYWKSLDKKSLNGKVFYIIEDSSYLNDIADLSMDFFTDGGIEGISHFGIFLSDDCFEVLTDLAPILTIQRIEVR